MNTNRSFFGIACRVAAFSFLMAGTASLMQAQQSLPAQSTFKAPLLLASESAPASFSLSNTSSSSSSSSDDAVASDGTFLTPDTLNSLQPPPRRTYGRPNYSDSHSNPDGSPKWTGLGGVGLTLPVGDTHVYETPSWGLQAGFGRNFNKSVGVIAQFDYDHFGLQGATLANQNYIYDYGCPAGSVAAGNCGVSGLDGNNHVWSFTLNPTYTIPTEGSTGAYLVVGGGFYHKVTNFTEPTVEESCYFYCEEFQVNANIDHYTSNAGGVNGGFGLTYKFSKFSNQRFYVEARYVLMLNQQRNGLTSANVGTTFGTNYTGTNFYPANSHRTTYIPIKFGIRF
jgi:hypothetical protein